MLYLKNLVKIIFVDEMNVSNGKEVQVQIEQIHWRIANVPSLFTFMLGDNILEGQYKLM